MAKEGERGYIRPGNLCPEDFLNLRYLNNAKLRDPIFVRQLGSYGYHQGPQHKFYPPLSGYQGDCKAFLVAPTAQL